MKKDFSALSFSEKERISVSEVLNISLSILPSVPIYKINEECVRNGQHQSRLERDPFAWDKIEAMDIKGGCFVGCTYAVRMLQSPLQPMMQKMAAEPAE